MPKFTGPEMSDMLKAAAEKLKIGSRWQHYKGGVYTINDFAIGTEGDEVVVIYQRIDGPGYTKGVDSRIQFARPMREWLDPIDNAREEPVQRFTRVEKVEVWQPVREEPDEGS